MQVRFTVEADGYPPYSDALYFTPAEYAALSPEALEELKQERWQAWRSSVDSPPEEPPAPELAAVDSVERARAVLTEALAKLDTQE